MEFEFLADRPDALDLVSHWYYHEWGRANPNGSPAAIARKLSHSMNRDMVPLVVLAIDRNVVVGSVELKYREMAIYPDMIHWLGGLYVTLDYRGRGIASQLVERVVDLAGDLGIGRLYLQTERLDGGIYAGLGWKPCKQVCNKGIDILVMEIDVGE
ncbi:MAG: GNAT family N-acetyltransferase [Gammaproteobacteria bacterium]|nr:GNAT family N-acetyltransferase [Gammaproteobacteria bacterium]|tara:strand:- start:448 stop:915 length:468 start_codon:yes stop_codon:yes gene_type:complete